MQPVLCCSSSSWMQLPQEQLCRCSDVCWGHSLPPFSATGSCFSVTESPICWGNFKGFGTTHQVFCIWHKKESWGDFTMPVDRNIQTKLDDKQNFGTKQPLTERELLLYQCNRPTWCHQLLLLLRESHRILWNRMWLAKLGQTNPSSVFQYMCF